MRRSAIFVIRRIWNDVQGVPNIVCMNCEQFVHTSFARNLK